MSDITNNLTTDQDLLDILSGTSSSNTSVATNNTVSVDSDEDEANKKLQELKDIASQLSIDTNNLTPGSGNIDDDLSNWFEGRDALPSGALTNYVSNSSVKMEYGLQRQVLSSYSLMGKLYKFLSEDAFDVLFNEQALLSLDSEEVESRVKIAFTMYERLAALNAKVNRDLKDYKLKSNTDNTDIDRLSLLLGSIPSEKLNKILEEIAYTNKKG